MYQVFDKVSDCNFQARWYSQYDMEDLLQEYFMYLLQLAT